MESGGGGGGEEVGGVGGVLWGGDWVFEGAEVDGWALCVYTDRKVQLCRI